jgi:CRISPR-associated protein Cas1
MSRVSKKPSLESRWGMVYLEFGHLVRKDHALVFERKNETTVLPVARLACLLLGPGTTVTAAAVAMLARHGVTACWTGKDAGHFYQNGLFGQSSRRLLVQVERYGDVVLRRRTARRLLERRTGESLDGDWDIETLRGFEGRWMKKRFRALSEQYGIPWTGRQSGDWEKLDPVNRALSVANGCLYALCHCAVVAAGFSPAIGFLHSGDMRSFVFDVADLYKPEATLPVAFEIAATGLTDPAAIERKAHAAARDRFRDRRLYERIVPDLMEVLECSP